MIQGDTEQTFTTMMTYMDMMLKSLLLRCFTSITGIATLDQEEVNLF